MTESKKGLNSFQLKLLGIIAMTLDHIGLYICHSIDRNPLRIIGRIAAPLFLYVMINSLSHTRNKKRYILRLYIAHIFICLMALFASTAGQEQFGSHDPFSILSIFVYTAIFICIIEKIADSTQKKMTMKTSFFVFLAAAIIIIPIVIMLLFSRFEILCQIFLPNILIIPYSPLFVLMGVCWYFAKDKNKQAVILVLFSCLSLIGAQLLARLNSWVFMDFFHHSQFFMILFVPFIYLYNGRKGKSIKYFFYIYYPVHIFALMLIGQSF